MQSSPDLRVFTERESQVFGYCRRFNVLFVTVSGSELVDAGERRYIDFLAGCGSLNYGHNDSDMGEALVAHIRRNGLVTAMDLHTDAKLRFLDLFSRLILAPRSMDRRVQFTGPTGANAVGAALKLSAQGHRPAQHHRLHQRLPRRIAGRAGGNRQPLQTH